VRRGGPESPTFAWVRQGGPRRGRGAPANFAGEPPGRAFLKHFFAPLLVAPDISTPSYLDERRGRGIVISVGSRRFSSPTISAASDTDSLRPDAQSAHTFAPTN
jgi:hypothetical protein